MIATKAKLTIPIASTVSIKVNAREPAPWADPLELAHLADDVR